MSSWIGIYGRNQVGRDWLKQNYKLVNEAFEKIHPDYEGVGPQIFKHSIAEKDNTNNPLGKRFSYYW